MHRVGKATVNITPAQVRAIAERHGWRLDIEYPSYFQFTKDLPHPKSKLLGNRGIVEVNLRTGVVKTTLIHPRLGRSTMCRRIVSSDRLWNIFENPRVHHEGGFFPENPHGELGAEWLTQ